LRRLFSNFADGLPGAGILLLRLAAGGAAIAHGLTSLRAHPQIGPTLLDALAVAAGTSMVAGLGTPVSGSLMAALGFWNALSQQDDRWAQVLLGTIGSALALLGPGAWSVDARLFGWKRIDIRYRKNQPPVS
jgi:putative oxidoreductase